MYLAALYANLEGLIHVRASKALPNLYVKSVARKKGARK
jgi:hypothetical protein